MIMAGALTAASVPLQAQFDFTVAGRNVQFHSFVQQGFAYSNENNFLTMNTSKGSFGMFDAGANVSVQINDKLRVGAQVYDRILGNLDKGQVQLDWAMVSYAYKPWLGFRVGKVKTVLGLYNDVQDMEFLHTFALLPQSMYPTDQRSNLIAHEGIDFTGDIPVRRLGNFSYTVYGGRRPNAPHEGFIYTLQFLGVYLNRWTGWLGGADLKWTTPVKGLMVGASFLDQYPNGSGPCPDVPNGCPGGAWETEQTAKDQTFQYYFQYQKGNLTVDAEYRRRYRRVNVVDTYSDSVIGPYYPEADSRSWYGSAAYRLNNHWSVGGYYSWYVPDWRGDHSAPDDHIWDRAITARYDINRHWNVKAEAHFMNGFGQIDSSRGFYGQENPGDIPTNTGAPGYQVNTGLKPVTNLLVLRTGWVF